MSMFRKHTETIPAMPQDVMVPKPQQAESNGGEITAWTPKRHHNLHIGEAEDTVIRAAGVFKDLKEQLASQEAQIGDRDIRIGILEGRIRDLELANAQSRNDVVMANQVRDEALRETLFWRGKLSAIRSVVDDDEIPLPARRKAKKNGDQVVQAPVAENEAPKHEEAS